MRLKVIFALVLISPMLAFGSEYSVKLNSSAEGILKTKNVAGAIVFTNGNAISVNFLENEIKQKVLEKKIDLQSLSVIKACSFNWTLAAGTDDSFVGQMPIITDRGIPCVLDEENKQIILEPKTQVKRVTVNVVQGSFDARKAKLLMYRFQPRLADENPSDAGNFKTVLKVVRGGLADQMFSHYVFYTTEPAEYTISPTWYLSGGGSIAESKLSFSDSQITLN